MQVACARFNRLALAVAGACLVGSAPAWAVQAGVNVGEVQANTTHTKLWKRLQKTNKKLTQKKIFESGNSQLVINKDEMSGAGPVGGAAGALAMSPGVRVVSSGSVGANRAAISVDGLQQGWGGLNGGLTDNGSLGVTFDGVPMNNPGSGLWSTAQMPELSMLQGINITYGPGNPASRWYDSLGGTIGFVPVQPGTHAGGNVGLSLGSYDTENSHFVMKTGLMNGYSMVLAGAQTRASSFRNSPDGFANPNHDEVLFGKLIKAWNHGDVGLGAYMARSSSYRPSYIPVAPVPGLTVNGYLDTGASVPGPLYSQQTSGFYSLPPYAIWHKQANNDVDLLYMPLDIDLSRRTTMHNLLWYRHGLRLHNHFNDFNQGAANLFEYNNPSDTVYGDKLDWTIAMPANFVTVGGYVLHSRYNSRNAFYNPYYDAINNPTPTTYQSPEKYRSSYFDQIFGAVFLEDKVTLLPDLSVTPGVRFVHMGTQFTNAGLQDFPQANPANNQDQLPNASTSYNKFEPSVSGRYAVSRHIALYGSYAWAFENPQNGGGGGPFQQENASALVPEKAVSIRGGVKFHIRHAGLFRHFALDLDLYKLHLLDQLISVTLSNGNAIEATGDTRFEGANLYGEDDPVKGLHVFANLGLEKATYGNYTTGGVSYQGLTAAYVPKETLSAGVFYRIYKAGLVYMPKLWDVFTGPQHIFSNAAGTPLAQTMPGYNLVNGAFSVIIPTGAGGSGGGEQTVKITFSVLNLLNKQYNEYEYVTSGGYFGGASAGATLAYPGAPRTYYISADLRF